MSWETMGSETRPCSCGRGTIVYERQMDDWNRVRELKTIDCDTCREADAKRRNDALKAKERYDQLTLEAFKLADERYFPQWLSQYSGKSKQEIWNHLIGKGNYPALGTFYKHVRDTGGLSKYLSSYFRYHFEELLVRMDIRDSEINGLFSQRPAFNSKDLEVPGSRPLYWYDR